MSPEGDISPQLKIAVDQNRAKRRKEANDSVIEVPCGRFWMNSWESQSATSYWLFVRSMKMCVVLRLRSVTFVRYVTIHEMSRI